jgi:hypothetical protein
MEEEGQPKKKLLDQVRDRLRMKHYAYRTEQSYVDWIRRYILFHNKRHPQDMGVAEVEAFFDLSCGRRKRRYFKPKSGIECLFILPYQIVHHDR